MELQKTNICEMEVVRPVLRGLSGDVTMICRVRLQNDRRDENRLDDD